MRLCPPVDAIGPQVLAELLRGRCARSITRGPVELRHERFGERVKRPGPGPGGLFLLQNWSLTLSILPWSRWFRCAFKRAQRLKRVVRPRPSTRLRPQLESLEDRALLSVATHLIFAQE